MEPEKVLLEIAGEKFVTRLEEAYKCDICGLIFEESYEIAPHILEGHKDFVVKNVTERADWRTFIKEFGSDREWKMFYYADVAFNKYNDIISYELQEAKLLRRENWSEFHWEDAAKNWVG